MAGFKIRFADPASIFKTSKRPVCPALFRITLCSAKLLKIVAGNQILSFVRLPFENRSALRSKIGVAMRLAPNLRNTAHAKLPIVKRLPEEPIPELNSR
jgi:hypothetical protein